MGVVVAVLFIIGFIVLLAFVPADKIMRSFKSDNNRCCHKNEDWRNNSPSLTPEEIN